MECAGRGLAFWSYQSTQEMWVAHRRCHHRLAEVFSVYQEYLAKTLTDKYSTLNAQMDKVLNDANSELNILNQRINSRPSFRFTSSLFSDRWCYRHAT